MAHEEKIFDTELKKHLPWSADWWKIRRDQNMSVVTKLQLYEVLVVSVFTNGAECWTLNRDDERKITAAEMNWLRRLSGVSKLQDKIIQYLPK